MATVLELIKKLQAVADAGHGNAIATFQTDSMSAEIIGAADIGTENKKKNPREFLIMYGTGELIFSPLGENRNHAKARGEA